MIAAAIAFIVMVPVADPGLPGVGFWTVTAVGLACEADDLIPRSSQPQSRDGCSG